MKKILSIGAHPDDPDVSSAGLLFKLKEAGWEVRLLSLTDGGAGTLGNNGDRAEVTRIRRAEAFRSGELFGGRYDVLDYPDGMLKPTLEARETLIRYIRRYKPDVIITNRPCDYHPDHRAAATLVQDASYMLIVPYVCPDTPSLDYVPTILYWHDDFRHPYTFEGDVLVPLAKKRADMQTQVAACHESQYFDWLYFPDQMEKRDWPREKQIADKRVRYMKRLRNIRTEMDARVKERFGNAAEGIDCLEAYELCEYGGDIDPAFLAIAETVE